MAGKLNRSIRIVALGSPHGDDQVGWAIAERLSQDSNVRPFIHILASPWDLIELLQPGHSVIVVDAYVGSASPGTVLRVEENDLANSPINSRSTHSGSLIESLKLAKSLGKEIRELVVFAVAVESSEPNANLSESARYAVNETVQRIQNQLREWLPT